MRSTVAVVVERRVIDVARRIRARLRGRENGVSGYKSIRHPHIGDDGSTSICITITTLFRILLSCVVPRNLLKGVGRRACQNLIVLFGNNRFPYRITAEY